MPNVAYYRQQIEELRRAQQEENSAEAALRKAQANLFFDENSQLEFLARRRFPNDPVAPMRYKIINGEIMYEDDNGQLQPEFEGIEDASFFEEYITPNLVPATTVAADIGGGMYGAGKGFQKGLELAMRSPVKHPLAQAAIVLGSTALGGFGGNLVVGGAARLPREALIDQFYNLPPEELMAAGEDLLISSGFSAIPFGAGPARQVMNKFTGKEDTLQYLINLRGSVQETIDEARKFGVELTPAEAADFATRAVDIQYFLSRQPQIRAVRDFYARRAPQMREAIELFADKLGSVAPGRYGDTNTRVQAAAQQAMEEIQARRKNRAAKLYDSLRDEEIEVDISPIIKKLDEIIKNTKRPQSTRDAAAGFRRGLMEIKPEQRPILDAQGVPRRGNQNEILMQETDKEVELPLTNLMDIHDRRTTDLEDVIKSNLHTANGEMFVELRKDLTRLLDAADESGTYRLARRVYDETKPQIDLVQRSAIGKLSSLVTDKKTASAVKALFDPDVSVASLRNARRVLQAVDKEAFKDAKKYFIQNKLEEATKQTVEMGLPGFQNYFESPKTRRALQELLEPEEFENFYKMMGFVGDALRTVPRGGSVTQPLLAQEQQLAKEVGGMGTGAFKLALATLRLPGRLATGQVGDDILRNIAMKQAESYYKAMADVLFSDDAAESVANAYNYFNKVSYGGLQGAGRAVGDAVGDIGEEQYEPTPEDLERMRQEMEALENPQSSATPQPSSMDLNTDIFDPLPQTGGGMSSMGIPGPTVLPSDQDRELAERLRQARSGIGGLAV
jgi:hypothetical protein